ncbi:MAG: N-acetylmuramoyl-L-alanine amidase, partial [Thermoflexales bacterium]|nr:N-acetylmuramoyl-L-alanine amidase [Thermoflexales bacterium]
FLNQLTDLQAEAINQQFNATLMPYNFTWLAVNARDTSGNLRLISSFVKTTPQPHKETLAPSSQPPSTASSLTGVGGGLNGKTVFVSAGHGWLYNTTFGYYKTARPVYPLSPYPAGEGLIEDFNNAEFVNQYLLKYLWNSGADAWTVRERDLNTNMIIADNASVNFSTQGTWSSGSGGQGGTYRYAAITATATATATWTFTPTTRASYAVYIWFPNVTATRTLEAHYYIDHAGGTTPIALTQARDGNNWRYIGDFPFYANQAARVRLTNQSTTTGAIVLADAIRVGGGRGDVSLNGAPVSNKPRWEEQASQYAKWVNQPDAGVVSDVWVRPRYAEWEKESSEDAVYVSWHTNGYNGYNTTARGTETYRYLTPTAGSQTLQSAVHTELLSAIQSSWEATWPDRGQLQRDLGEVGQLSTMPGVLIENGFHDNPTDATAMKDARFMQISARAVYHGLVKYWNSIDPNVPLVYLPEPPTRLQVRNSGAGQVTLTWQPGPTDGSGPLGDAATTYRVYTSPDGFGWDNGVPVASSTYTLSNLVANQLIYVKVTGVNLGGESFATPVLAARVAASGSAPLLIVYGFDRIDGLSAVQQNDPNEGLSRRVLLDRMNRYDYIIQHAEAITLPFDSALHAVISTTQLSLGNYQVIDWIAGEEQAPFPSLTASDQSQLSAFVSNGGALLLSGAEIGFELKNTAFYATTLRATYTADDANTHTVTSVTGGVFDGLGAISFDDGTHGTYEVDFADVFNPIGPATSALVYNNAAGSAAVQYANGCSRLIYSGVPLETIYPASARQAVFERALRFLSACVSIEFVDTTIDAPAADASVNSAPPVNGTTSGSATSVQVSVRRVSDTLFYNGTDFASGAEVWLNANSTQPWTYTLPALLDSAYALRARALGAGPITDTTPAAITFTLDTLPPAVSVPITPTGGITLATAAPQFSWTADGQPDRFEVQLDGALHPINSATPQARLAITEGLHVWRVRAGDAAGNWSAWSDTAEFKSTAFKVYLPLVLNQFAQTPPTTTCTNILINGDFETGDLTDWVTLAANPLASVTASPVNAGQFAARVGKLDTSSTITGFSSIQQDFIIPANAVTATVSFARYRYSNDLADLQYTAVTSGTAIAQYLILEHVNDPQWVTAQFDLLPYAGRTIGLRFSVWNKTAASVTGLVIDDVKVDVCVP